MLRHKRALHKYSREKLDRDYTASVCEDSEIVRVIKQDGNLYLCVTTEGELEWSELDSANEKVVEFLRIKSSTYSGIPVVDVVEWAKHDLIET